MAQWLKGWSWVVESQGSKSCN